MNAAVVADRGRQQGQDETLRVLGAYAERQLAGAVPGQTVLVAERRWKKTDRHEVRELEQRAHRDADRRSQHDLDSELACSPRNMQHVASKHVGRIRREVSDA